MADAAKLLKQIEGLSKDDKSKLRKALGVEDDPAGDPQGEFYKDRVKSLAQIAAMEAKIAEAQGRSFDAQKQTLEVYKQIKKLTEAGVIDISNAKTEDEKRALIIEHIRQEMGMTVEEAAKLYDEGVKLEKQFARFEEVMNKGARVGQEFFGDLANKLGMAARPSDTLIGKLQEINEVLADPEAKDKFLGKFKEIFSFTNIAASIFAKFVESTIKYAFAVDKATAAFAANTGAGRAVTKEIINVGSSFRNLGLTAEDAGKAAESLMGGLNSFLKIDQETRESVMKTVAGLEKLGVALDDSVVSVAFFSKNLGMTEDAAANMTREIALTGKSLGMTASQITKSFNDSLKTLAVYGDKAPKVFKGLASMASAANVEIAELLDLAGKFDTFADAAETTGKLNAILGSQLSSTDMLMMKENERIETLISTMQAQGMAFKDMDRFTQKAIASAAGIDDINKAQKVFGMNLGQFRQHAAEADAAAKSEEEMNKRMKDSMDIMKKLQMIFMEMAADFAPFIEGLAGIVQGFLDFMAAGDGLVGKLLVIGAGFKLLMAFLPGFSTLIGALGGAILPTLSTSLAATSKTVAGASGGFLAGSAGIAAFGASLFLVAVPIALVVGAVGFLAMAIGKMFSSIIESIASVGELGSQIGSLVPVLTALGAIGLLGGFGLAMTAGALTKIGKAISGMDEKKLSDVAKLMDALTRGDEEDREVAITGRITQAKGLIKDLADNETTVKPMLEDLALISTGTSARNMTAAAGGGATEGFGQLTSLLKKKLEQPVSVEIVLDKTETESFLENFVINVQRKA